MKVRKLTEEDLRFPGRSWNSFLKNWTGCGKEMCWCWPEASRTICRRQYTGRSSGLRGRNILTAVDAAGGLLRHALSCRPFLIKPNLRELEGLFGITLRSRDEAVFRAGRLQDMGARNVLVSLGARGAVLLDENGKVHSLPAPEGKLVNAVGAGDSMTAGFLAGWLREKDYEYAFRLGIAAGSASAFSENLAGRQEIEQLLKGLI